MSSLKVFATDRLYIHCIFKISIWASVNNSDGDDNRVDNFTSLPPLGNMSISLAKHQ